MRTCILATCLLIVFHAPAQTRPLDVLHYRFFIELSDTTNRIQGVAQIQFRLIQPTEFIEIDLTPFGKDGKGMQVSRIDEAEKETNRLSFQWTNEDKIRIRLSRIYHADDTTSIAIHYQGIPRNGLIISKNKYGDRTFFADNWPNRAHQWIPCVDDPADKASVEFLVVAPDHYQVVSNGVPASAFSHKNGTFTTSHWIERVPLPTKVMVIGVAKFSIDTVGYFRKNIPVSSWVFPQDSSSGFQTYAQALPILYWMSDYIGPYAYQKLANVQSKTIFGGMENANAIFYYENSVDGKEKEEDLIAHEIAHQWFGNMATEKNFHHLWLSEGFATYLTHRYLETKYGDAVLKARLQTDREKINEFLHRTPRPVVDSTSNYMSLLNANSYEKGGWILHMLRKQVGDSAFHRILQAYYTRYAGKNADTDDFRAVVEAVTGNSWSQFFEQWLHRKQNPSLQVNWKNGGKGKPLEITLRQLQEGPSFEFPLKLELIDLQGNKQRKRLDVKNTEHQFLLPMKAQIASVLIDPDTELLIDRVLITEME